MVIFFCNSVSCTLLCSLTVLISCMIAVMSACLPSIVLMAVSVAATTVAVFVSSLLKALSVALAMVSVADAMGMMSESEKKRVDQDAATIRRSARAWLLRRHYMKLREATVLVQKSLRRKWQRREQSRRDEAGRKIERWVRSVKAAVVLQNEVRQDRRSQAASLIQKWTRHQQHQKRRRRE